MSSAVLFAKNHVWKARCRAMGLLSRIPRRFRLDRPVFITGCGRSGTSILGQALSFHPAVRYLREPRYLWQTWYPETDLGTAKAVSRNGRLVLDESDCRPEHNTRLRRFFYLETVLTGKKRLVEKLPENNFRLSFLHAIFPDAYFVHIMRNGIEVARSIERWGSSWYGAGEYKWHELAALARKGDQHTDLPALCSTIFERGLLEWRLSLEAAAAFIKRTPEARYLETTYEALLTDPTSVLETIERFVGLEPSEEVHSFVRDNIGRRSLKLSSDHLTVNGRKLAGDMLEELGYLND